MTLTLEEKKRLLEKGTQLYDKIIAIKIRREIKVDTITKYYSQTSKYANYGFNYYVNGGMGIHCEDIKDSLKELKEYIEKREKEPNGYAPYINSYRIDALLDFIYNEDRILSTIQRINEEERKELDNLLG